MLVRTGQLARARREGWGDYAGGAAPGLSFTTADWLHGSEIAAIATDTWGFEVRPNEFDNAFQPLHQVAIPNIGLFLGEMWDLDALAEDCAADGIYEFFLTAAPLAGHRRRRRPGQPDRRQMSTTMQQGRLAGKIAVITGTAGGQGREAAVRFAAEGATVYGCDVNRMRPPRPSTSSPPRAES